MFLEFNLYKNRNLISVFFFISIIRYARYNLLKYSRRVFGLLVLHSLLSIEGHYVSYRLRRISVEISWKKAEAWIHNRIDKSISQCSFPVYWFFTRDTRCNDASGGFSSRDSRTARKRQNQRSEGKRRNEFPPRSEKRLMT